MELTLPRSAFTPREVARAADLWRAFQDLAVGGSSSAGWPPARYREERVSFIVRAMVVVHHRETVFGEALRGATWPSRVQRGMFFRREGRLAAGGAPIASATQDWVHVGADLAPVRGSAALLDAFPEQTHEPPVALPAYDRIEGAPAHAFELECWHTWMDPLAHVNHPTYVGWADEALARIAAARGIDPCDLAPVAEEARFRSGVVASERVVVTTRLTGRAGEAAVCAHELATADGRRVAHLVTVRRLAAGGDLAALLRDAPPPA